jgi:chorismate mutase
LSDDLLRSLRDEITAIDRALLALVNRRITTVARLKQHKDEHGIAFLDVDREQRMIAERVAENEGPLSEAGLRVFYAELLALVKREL